jgi:hypothetical protein
LDERASQANEKPISQLADEIKADFAAAMLGECKKKLLIFLAFLGHWSEFL